MKGFISKKAFSLLELIIASVLVVIVILGMFSVNSVLSNNNQDYGQRYLVRSETQTTLNHILNNASLAIGGGTTIVLSNGASVTDKGILTGTDLEDNNSFCIHQDIQPPNDSDQYTVEGMTVDNAPTNTSPSSPPNYTNSRWLCYTFYGSAAATPNQIYYCAMPYTLSPPNRGAAGCSGVANAQFLGSAFSISTLNGNSSPPSFSFDGSSAGNPLVFTITLQNCLDNSSATGTCLISGTSKDPINNPEVQLSGSVSPSQHGMQN